jgi:uncharacterized repeat protein (TIGR04076 family)
MLKKFMAIKWRPFMTGEKTVLVAEVVEAKGTCSAGHQKGDEIELDCMKPGGLCGYFYHQIFPSLQTLENGGKMPWWENGEEFMAACADPMNTVTLRIKKRKG